MNYAEHLIASITKMTPLCNKSAWSALYAAKPSELSATSNSGDVHRNLIDNALHAIAYDVMMDLHNMTDGDKTSDMLKSLVDALFEKRDKLAERICEERGGILEEFEQANGVLLDTIARVHVLNALIGVANNQRYNILNPIANENEGYWD